MRSFFGPYFSIFSPNTGKFELEKSPCLDSFRAVTEKMLQLLQNLMKHLKYLPSSIIDSIKFAYSHFFPSIRMLFLIGAVSPIGYTETEKLPTEN